MVEKRGAFQGVLKGTKSQKLKMPRRTLTELTPKNRKNTLKVKYTKLNVLTSPTKQV